MNENDVVNHPAHYTSHPSGIECIELVHHMPFNIGNAIKYVFRSEHKGKAHEDVRKAIWYVTNEIEDKTIPLGSPQPLTSRTLHAYTEVVMTEPRVFVRNAIRALFMYTYAHSRGSALETALINLQKEEARLLALSE